MSIAIEKFQQLLRELFQFDSSDLDFGIYRIMNYKRDVIEKFIENDLTKAIESELDQGQLADQSYTAKELASIQEQIFENFGRKAIDADGNLADAFHETPLGRTYLELQGKAAGSQAREGLETIIFNHLYTFFSRYYQDGDFISKRRYSKRQKYAIPYNGEEVYLHWANHDQYYVKTGEHFHDYTFISHGIKGHFKIKEADIEQNNVKGDSRFFLPRVKEIVWYRDSEELVIPFEYRPLNEQEKVTYSSKQEKIITEALETIPKNIKKADKAIAALTAERRKNAEGRSVSYLEHHLRQYTRRNTSDFFIHKNLKSFLSQELDFYLKNEVLNLDEIEAAGENRSEGWFQIMRVIKTVGSRIIDFLDQIESFQKMLWEKRKFVTETQYCITVGNIDESFYPEIAECEAQWDEWKELLHIDEEKADMFYGDYVSEDGRVDFIKTHPLLVLDTKHFSNIFVDKILENFNNLDELNEGLLIDSENFQAISLIRDKFQNKVKSICTDPPYNTGDDGFIYKDSYKSSSWLSMLYQVTNGSAKLLDEKGSLFINCDENQFLELGILLRSIFGTSNHIETITWNKRVPKNDKGIGNIHEYVYLFSKDSNLRKAHELSYVMRKDGLEDVYELVNKFKKQKKDLEKSKTELKKYYKKQGFDRGITLYCELDPEYEIWGKINMSWPNPKTEGPRYEITNPVTGKPTPIPKNGWRWKESTFRSAENQGPTYKLPDGSLMKGRIWYPKDTKTQPSSITYLKEVDNFLLRSILSLKSDGSLILEQLGLGGFVDYPKPTTLTDTLCYSTMETEGYFLDYFAGSGTTGHSIINLNREDKGNRKFILIEMGEYFDTVLLRRIKKVIFTPEWKDGKPKRMPTKEEVERSPRIIKYQRLESYEDALNNIQFDEESGQGALGFDDYLLKYMLNWETKKSETLLNIEKLANPFDYKLRVVEGEKTTEKTVDIPETFNYLLGLHVKTRKVYGNNGQRYLVFRGQIDHREVAVIWRNIEDWTKEDLEKDKKFVIEQQLTEGADEVFVNGDSFIPEAKSLDPIFKARMFAEVQ